MSDLTQLGLRKRKKRSSQYKVKRPYADYLEEMILNGYAEVKEVNPARYLGKLAKESNAFIISRAWPYNSKSAKRILTRTSKRIKPVERSENYMLFEW